MTPEKLQSIAFKWFESFNNKELEKLLSLYDDDAEHFSPKLKIRHPETNGLVKGKQALREWWQDAFNRLPSLNYKVTSLTANGDRIFMEYTRTVEGEEEMFIAEVLNIREDKIVASRVYHG
ncbi:nuclear transport factor 2 family protein [Flavobacterium sp. XN-5]|uniref:nuclear transport factor 2 family protein n=1 Tax=Flavobacterium sp. XN-5 TaxID=2599390 RepID=UPI0011CAAA37|nr:nuclear transport factor 2 family protein [Flavobacterium sp. XN-5]NGY38679.1 nuclear transport factor 2 family protein [Flavobacterium sp. XN-5]